MSWLDKVNTGMVITCGDGKSFTPQWINATRNKEYNIAVFEFKELSGSLVKRGTPRGWRYNVEIYFSGIDHLDQADAFSSSADNSGIWTVSHPFYGALYVHPTDLTFDNSAYNVTKITGGLLETISEGNRLTTSPADKISSDKEAVDSSFAEAYTTDVANPDSKDIKQMRAYALSHYNAVKDKITSSVDYANYYNMYNAAQADISLANKDVGSAVSGIQQLISLPASFENDIVSRFSMFVNMLNALSLPALLGSQKRLYELNAAAIITGMIGATVLNVGNTYKRRTDVLSIIDNLTTAWDIFLQNLDALQTFNGGSPQSYIASPWAMSQLSHLLSFTISTLLSYLADARQERVVYVPADTNIINLAYEIYGLKSDDSTIDDLIDQNNIGMNELLQIKKGRKIIYLV